MLWITLIIQLIPVIMKLMDIAEKLWGKKEGKYKKNMVVSTIKGIVIAKCGKEDWDKVEEAISEFIDTVCMGMYPNEEED